MLLYDFGSKDELVNAILAEIRRREERLLDADVRTLEDVWSWISAPERACWTSPKNVRTRVAHTKVGHSLTSAVYG